MKLVIFGANGFLGRVLTRYFLRKGDVVIAVARREDGCEAGAIFQKWDGLTHGNWVESLDYSDAIINLAGRTVNCRYSEKNKAEILESRTHTTMLIGEAIQQLKNPPKVWVNSSTATIYQHTEKTGNNSPNTEADGVIGEDFSMGIAKAWEEVFFADSAPVRKVATRTAIVLGAEKETVFDVLSKITRLGLGGKMGNGKQMMSWIHEYDFCRAVDFCIQKDQIKGAVNLVSPKAETNSELMRLLRKTWGIPLGLPAYKWMLEIGTFIMRSETELVLKSRWAYPKVLEDAGFTFKMPELERALLELKGRI